MTESKNPGFGLSVRNHLRKLFSTFATVNIAEYQMRRCFQRKNNQTELRLKSDI